MTTTGKLDVHDLGIDSTLVGAAMRDELVIMYNKLAYWTEEHSKWDAEKKEVENLLEEAKDMAKAIRATQAEEKALKAKIQEAFIRDFWSVKVELVDTNTGEIRKINCSELMDKFIKAAKNETLTRHKMNLCNTALDIGRTCVSWDKTELSRMETGNSSR